LARTEKERASAASRAVTPTQLREAERGLKHVLAPTFPARWIAENVSDVLNEAIAEYVEWLSDHKPLADPVGWLVERGRWRALDRVKRENRRSGPSIDAVIHLVEDPAPTPEDALLERDRHRRIADALSHIPERDRKLLALVYYEGHSIRAAGRLLGWGKSSADSHHAEAMKRLRALVGERELLSPALVGLVAQAMVLRDRTRLVGGIANRISAAVQDLTDLVAKSIGTATRGAEEAARRAAPFTDPGTATVSGNAGRILAQCGTLAVICGALLLSPAEDGIKTVLPNHRHGSTQAHERRPPPGPSELASPPALAPSPRAEELSRSPGPTRSEIRRRRAHRRRRRARIAQARRAQAARKTKARRLRRNENIEASEREAAAEAVEATPETEAPTETIEAAPEVETAAPPATGAQVQEEFGH
jgi:RNA polymerase sigma factor (sigma-70 family)